jgi:TonB family protein
MRIHTVNGPPWHRILKFSLSLACAVSIAPAQNQPRLRRIEGVVPPNVHGNLAGFKPLQPIWPNLKTVESHPPDGIRVSVLLTVSDGKPVNVELLEGIRPFTKPVLDALQRWSFQMPFDGTSPVMFEVMFKSSGGQFMPDVEVYLPPIDQQPRLEILSEPAAVYPASAMSLGIEGTVEFRVTVNQDGSVANPELIRGPEPLRQSAFEAVRQFRYKPDARLPHQVTTSIKFRLP